MEPRIAADDSVVRCVVKLLAFHGVVFRNDVQYDESVV